MSAKKRNIQEPPLSNEEIQQVRAMLAKLDERAQQTVTSSEQSFWKWMSRISSLLSIMDKLKSLPWEQILSWINNIF